MSKSHWKNLLRLTRDTRGTEIVESAFVLPLVFMFVIGIFWFGLAFFIYGTLAQGTRAAAEAAVAPVCTTCTASTTTTAQNAQAAVYNSLAVAHLNKNNLVATTKWTAPTLCTCGSVATSAACIAAKTPVSCDGTIPDVCVQPNVQLSYPGEGGAGTCGTSVSARYQYPFHFSIPLTNLDLGNVLLPGQAEMRAETQ